MEPQFPPDFVFGVATSSYQIEGATSEDGRGPSIWDTYAGVTGAIADGSTGDVACDHYHRYGEDVALIAELGAGAYRFSIAWPRVQPAGSGAANDKGLDFYDRLVDTLLSRGVQPLPTLFHWDLPQALQDAGGWQNRDTAARFAEYAEIVARRLGDRVDAFITLNEPSVFTEFGHITGTHAPGLTLGGRAFSVVHHLLLGHGLATAALRSAVPAARVGITVHLAPVSPASPDAADVDAAALLDGVNNRTYLDPVLTGRYPDRLDRLWPGADVGVVRGTDLAVIGAPIDFLGVNFYMPFRAVAAPDTLRGYAQAPIDAPLTGFGWPVVPSSFTELLVGLQETYDGRLPPIYITENGAAYDDDKLDADGKVRDDDRIAYYAGHLAAVHDAMATGVDVRGYFAWSLLDNFEWGEGYRRRFGLVHVDFDTLVRTPKASYAWYRGVIAGSRTAAR